MFEREPAAGAPEPGDHFVGGKEHIVPVADLADTREVVIGRHDDTTNTDHRLGEKHRHRLGPFPQDCLLKLVGNRHAIRRAIGRHRAIGIRCWNVDEAGHSRLEERPVPAIPVALIAASVVPW